MPIQEGRLSNPFFNKIDFPKTLAAVRWLTGRWSDAQLKLVEDKANGSAVIQSLSHEIGGIVAINPEGGKLARAAAASPQLEAGNYPRIAPWVEAFIAKCAGFPNGANDDQVDAWSQGAKRLMTVRARQPRIPLQFHEPDRGEHGWMI